MAAASPPKPRGPFFDRDHLAQLHAGVTATLAPRAPAIESHVKGRAPVASGVLRGSVKVRVRKRKNGVAVVLTADAANAQGRPYGVFVEAATGFAAEALATAAATHIEEAVIALLNKTNSTLR